MAKRWIIERPQRVSRWRRSLWGAVTFVAWALFAWLLIPVATLVLWAFGLTTAYGSFAAVLPTVEPDLLALLAIAALIMSLSLLAWANLNRWRFAGKERRSRVPAAQAPEIAERYGVELPVMQALQE